MNKYTPKSAVMNQGDLRRKKIIFSENQRSYECINDSDENVIMFHIDGGLFPKSESSVRCDYGFEIDSEENRTCLVELKGHNLKHAFEQLYQTLIYFEENYPAKNFFCRIVSSGNKKPNIESIEEKRLSLYLRRKNYGKLKSGTKKISEKLSDLQ